MLGDKLDNYWPLKDIVKMLKDDWHIEVTETQLKEWAQRESTGFPEPHMVGRYAMYDVMEVKEWVVLWRRATSRLGRGRDLNRGKR
jgi:hypothetical protein